MRTLILLFLAALQLPALESVKIWDAAPHSAFTDLIFFKGQWICAFREGRRHVSTDGTLRLIASKDGKTWQSLSTLQLPDKDLRDPKLAVTPNNEILLTTAAAIRDEDNKVASRHDSISWLSPDGVNWRGPHTIGDPNFWLWRTTFHNKTAYAIGYPTNQSASHLRLYSTTDGITFQTLVDALPLDGRPNESTIRFRKNGEALALIRREDGPKTAILARALPPYKDWSFTDLKTRAGGPNFVEFRNRLIGVVRLYDGKVRTSLVEINPAGAIRELEPLPSSGDSSYAGLVVKNNELWISYYSSHEGKYAIYLARWRP
jgi:hypothetical protein